MFTTNFYCTFNDVHCMSFVLQRLCLPFSCCLAFYIWPWRKISRQRFAATGAPPRSGSIRRHAFPHFVEDWKQPCWYRSGAHRSGMARQRAGANIVLVPQYMPVIFADEISTLDVRYPGHFCVKGNHSSLANILVPCFSPQTTNFRNRQFRIGKYES